MRYLSDEDRMRMCERDKQVVAWHEAGHMVASVMLHGEFAGGEIWYEPTECDELKDWRGRCWIHETARSAAVCVAGMVAVQLMDEPNIEDFEIVEMWLYSEMIEPSATDYEGIPDEFELREAAVTEAWNVLRQHITLLRRVAEQLMACDEGAEVLEIDLRFIVGDYTTPLSIGSPR